MHHAFNSWREQVNLKAMQSFVYLKDLIMRRLSRVNQINLEALVERETIKLAFSCVLLVGIL
jgi:hypothetical protein